MHAVKAPIYRIACATNLQFAKILALAVRRGYTDSAPGGIFSTSGHDDRTSSQKKGKIYIPILETQSDLTISISNPRQIQHFATCSIGFPFVRALNSICVCSELQTLTRPRRRTSEEPVERWICCRKLHWVGQKPDFFSKIIQIAFVD